jgi:hypothetical protein
VWVLLLLLLLYQLVASCQRTQVDVNLLLQMHQTLLLLLLLLLLWGCHKGCQKNTRHACCAR